MKEKDVLAEFPEQQVIVYIEKEDGTYDAIQTGSFISANYIDDFFLKRKNLEKALQEKIEKREINAIGYYMIYEDLTISELAARMGLMKWTVRKHLRPDGFGKISEAALKKYSMVFNVASEEIVSRQSGNRK
ncbi:MAG: hypothetical protein ACOYM0_06270 [Bacteroidales bacterium]